MKRIYLYCGLVVAAFVALVLLARFASSEFSIRRNGSASFELDAGYRPLRPHVGFVFFSSTPDQALSKAAADQIRATFKHLATTGILVGDSSTEGGRVSMTGLELMAWLASRPMGLNVTISPFRGCANKSGSYGMMYGSAEIGEESITFVLLCCAEVSSKKKSEHTYDFEGLGLDTSAIRAIRFSKAVLAMECDQTGVTSSWVLSSGK